MSQKVIHVKIGDRIECIEFNSNTASDDLKETLRSAAEANQNDILKLYNSRGNLIGIAANLPANTAKDPYRLEVVVKNLGSFKIILFTTILKKNLIFLFTVGVKPNNGGKIT